VKRKQLQKLAQRCHDPLTSVPRRVMIGDARHNKRAHYNQCVRTSLSWESRIAVGDIEISKNIWPLTNKISLVIRSRGLGLSAVRVFEDWLCISWCPIIYLMLLSVLLSRFGETRCIWKKNIKVALQLSRIRFSKFPRKSIRIWSISIILRFRIVFPQRPDRVIIDSRRTLPYILRKESLQA
jgi:hypothetical protein